MSVRGRNIGQRMGRLRLGSWLLLFALVLLSLWLPTRGIVTPHAILLTLLFVITLNFSPPLTVGSGGLTPLAALLGLLALGPAVTLATAALGVLLAEALRPLWQPVWRATPAGQTIWQHRLGQAAALLMTIWLAGLFYTPLAGGRSLATLALTQLPLANPAWLAPALLTLIYILVYLLFLALVWRWAGHTLRRYFVESAPYLLLNSLLALALTAAVAPLGQSVPGFVLLSLGVGAFAMLSWTAWQRRFVLEQRLAQFAALNEAGAGLRQTLDWATVFMQVDQLVQALIPNDSCVLTLRTAEGVWRSELVVWRLPELAPPPADAPDDLTAWVLERGVMLELDASNQHYAARHGLQLPTPLPHAWMGAPLWAAGRVIGALVLQKLVNDEPFSRWDREILVAVAAQASAAIQNARRYAESVRLYTLTDEALARRVEQLQALLFSIHEGVVMIDRAGAIALVNPTGAALLNASPDQLLAQPLVPASMAAALGYTSEGLTRLLSILHQGETPAVQRTRYTWQRRIWERSETPVQAAQGEMMGWLLVFRDVTEEQARAAWRADLTRMIVHDLRNPVAALRSSVDLIAQAPADYDRAEIFAAARRSSDSLLEMVDSMMDIVRAEAGKFIIDAEVMRLDDLTASVVSYLQPLAYQRHIQLSLRYDTPSPLVWGDPIILRRVLVNLLDNALKFTPSGGKVAVRLESETSPIPGYTPGICVAIQDSGPGIPPEQRERIFERFVSFNQGGGQMQGTGLGLTFCKLAVEAHGGRIWVSAPPGGGSVFSFTVPGLPTTLAEVMNS